jgi:tRNA modification GTPase
MVVKAELVLHVLDANESLSAEDEQFLAEFAEKKRILVLNKCDLPRAGGWQAPARLIEVSCLTGAGLEALKDAIKQTVWAGEINAEMLQIAINSRHQHALQRARAATVQAAVALRDDATLELIAMDLRIAVNAVGEIVGKTTTEDLLDSIFSQFCIGK